MKENWSLHIDQSRAHTLELLVHFVNLSAVLLRRNRFARIQETVMDETGRRPPNSHHNLFLVQFRLREVLWSFSGIQPLCRTSPVVVEDPLLITRHNPLNKWVVFVAQMERRRHLKTTIYFNYRSIHAAPIYPAFLTSLFALNGERLLSGRPRFQQQLLGWFYEDRLQLSLFNVRYQPQTAGRDRLHLRGSRHHCEIS